MDQAEAYASADIVVSGVPSKGFQIAASALKPGVVAVNISQRRSAWIHAYMHMHLPRPPRSPRPPRPHPRRAHATPTPRPRHAHAMPTFCPRDVSPLPPPRHVRRAMPRQVPELRRGRGGAGQPGARGGQGDHRHARAQLAPAARQLPRANFHARQHSGARRAAGGGGRRRGLGAASCARAAVALTNPHGSASGGRCGVATCWQPVPPLLRVLPKARAASEFSPCVSSLEAVFAFRVGVRLACRSSLAVRTEPPLLSR